MTFALAVLAFIGDAPFDPLHPLRYWGYEFWSGIGSDIGEITIIGLMFTAVLTLWHHINCHSPRCPWPGRHVFIDPRTGEHFRTCGTHHAKAKPGAKWWRHPHSLEYIHERYSEAMGSAP